MTDEEEEEGIGMEHWEEKYDWDVPGYEENIDMSGPEPEIEELDWEKGSTASELRMARSPVLPWSPSQCFHDHPERPRRS
jgi:hypothetical protein